MRRRKTGLKTRLFALLRNCLERRNDLYSYPMQKPPAILKLTEFLTAEEQSTVKKNTGAARPHPVGLLLSREEGRSLHALNVERALKQVSIADMAWIEKMKPRIMGPNVTEWVVAVAVDDLAAEGVGVELEVGLDLFLDVNVLGVKLVLLGRLGGGQASVQRLAFRHLACACCHGLDMKFNTLNCELAIRSGATRK